ncbi:MAG: hypothetical protein KJO94_00305 [Eudoraea sp.]|nr:hypothetical protein [Eudoraea sp.]MBT8321891.1 hypothetical protein [Eudoraea sp.]NNJ38425.1 hypothetical protein [Flavobacteriaceae bacterium]
MKRYIVLILLLAVGFVGCTDRDDDLEAINIRIKNASTLNFDSVQVGESPEPYLNVAPDGYSGYQEFEIAFNYAFIQITSGEETYTLQPIDFVGETPLPLGFYTYELDISDTGEVTLNFVID